MRLAILIMSAALLWPGATCLLPLGQSAQAERFTFDFENGPGPLFDVDNTGDLWTIDMDGPTLRISKPEDPLEVQPHGFIVGGIRSRFSIEGDFTITVDYQLFYFPPDPTDGSSLNESLLEVEDEVPQVFEVLRLAHGSGGQGIEAFGPDAPVGGYDCPPEVLWSGRYRITRVGDTMTGAYALPGSDDFVVFGWKGDMR